MTTNARIYSEKACHYYTGKGEPCYEIPKADGKGMRAPTITDARKLSLLPSVTTILRVLPKPELQNWLIEQAVLAVLTTPRKAGEADDDFVHRVLHVEKVQDQERDLARDKGIAIHAGIEAYFTGQDVDPDIRLWVQPAIESLCKYGDLVCAERILVGDGYAGRTDLILEGKENWWIWDTKATKTLPDPKKGAWIEHQLQNSAYAAAFQKLLGVMELHRAAKPIRTANIYISSIEVGNFVICEHDPDWQKSFNSGFLPALRLWSFLNNYSPNGH